MHTNLKEPKQIEKKPSNVKITLWRQYKEWEDKTDLKKKKRGKNKTLGKQFLSSSLKLAVWKYLVSEVHSSFFIFPA